VLSLLFVGEEPAALSALHGAHGMLEDEPTIDGDFPLAGRHSLATALVTLHRGPPLGLRTW
jgi:hypothetical protein